jgi:hypothetical protein
LLCYLIEAPVNFLLASNSLLLQHRTVDLLCTKTTMYKAIDYRRPDGGGLDRDILIQRTVARNIPIYASKRGLPCSNSAYTYMMLTQCQTTQSNSWRTTVLSNLSVGTGSNNRLNHSYIHVGLLSCCLPHLAQKRGCPRQ